MNLVVLPQDPRSLGINSVYTDLRMFLCSALNRFSGYEDHGCGQRQGGNRGVEANSEGRHFYCCEWNVRLLDSS